MPLNDHPGQPSTAQCLGRVRGSRADDDGVMVVVIVVVVVVVVMMMVVVVVLVMVVAIHLDILQVHVDPAAVQFPSISASRRARFRFFRYQRLSGGSRRFGGRFVGTF